MASKLALTLARGSSTFPSSIRALSYCATNNIGLNRAQNSAFSRTHSTASTGVITKDEVVNALQAWCDGIVHIGKVFQSNGDYTTASKKFLDEKYAFDLMDGSGNNHNVVLFKPTKAAEMPIRHDMDSALSYFAATGLVNEDKGFAITPFTKIRHKISGMFITSGTATSMGHYWFTDLSGGETKVEFTFQYIRGPSGDLKIVLHHSSLPFNP
uniref:Phosphoribosyl-AMP cyclohydrolase n=1 Tax=Aureoumbra lagunensis TaxID=44058 RepID=A0A7S3JVB3_9STRA|mmetsp:Transcript_1106/g.1377  ORF Transcript_1106/g.1377 Transcript_1106/m.1377 type:complete len:212 (+) Transcript_1106:42-677(+)